MRYTITVEISLPRDRVIELFDSSENLVKWQPDLLRVEHVDGEPGSDGATTKLEYKWGKGTMEMLETVKKNDFPEGFDAIYEAGKFWNLVENRFTTSGDDKTSWAQMSEFRVKGLQKLMIILFPWMFRKQTRKMMHAFRDWAEAEESGGQ